MKLPRSLIALPVKWTASLSATVDDAAGLGPRTLIPSGTTWTRTFLAPSTGGTSEDSPTDLLRLVETALNLGGPPVSWSVTLSDTGLVKIEYLDAGTGEIVWGAAAALGRALGFTSNVGPMALGAPQYGDTLPAFCWFPYSLEGDTGPRAEHSLLSAAMHANGSVTAFDEGTQLVTRTMRARYAPASESVRTTRGMYATPFYPPSNAPTRWTAPSIAPGSCPEAWTVHETLSCAIGLRCAYVIGDLQSLIAGSSTSYYEGAFDPESARSRNDRSALSVAAYSSLIDVPSFTLSLRTTGTR